MFRCFLPFLVPKNHGEVQPPFFHCADPAGFELLGDHGLCTPSSRETRPEGMHPSARGEAKHGWPKGWLRGDFGRVCSPQNIENFMGDFDNLHDLS